MSKTHTKKSHRKSLSKFNLICHPCVYCEYVCKCVSSCILSQFTMLSNYSIDLDVGCWIQRRSRCKGIYHFCYTFCGVSDSMSQMVFSSWIVFISYRVLIPWTHIYAWACFLPLFVSIFQQQQQKFYLLTLEVIILSRT